jgi:hypothetical protein
MTMARLVAVRARGAGSCADKQETAVTAKTIEQIDVYIARFIGPLNVVV